jgi:hypothetical protein
MLFVLRISVVLLITLSPTFSFSAAIFSDNFDSHSDACHTGGSVPAGWDSWYEQGSTSATYDSTTHYGGEISSPGRGGTGKSLKIWRHASYPGTNDYVGGLGYTALPSGHGHIFIRYYMKIPTSLSLTYNSPAGDYLKFWRWNMTSGEIYLNLFSWGSNMRTSGDMRIIADGADQCAVIAAGALSTTVWDGNWHCLEFEMDVNSGLLRFYLDGSLYYQNTNVNYGSQANSDFDFMQHFAIGNISDNFSWQNSWQAFEFDDLVISTTYVGPDGVTPPTPPPPSPDPTPSPTPSASSGGGGCFIATAAFGSPMAPGVVLLREFRDRSLMGNDLGRALVTFYMEVSPPIANYIDRHDSAKFLVRLLLLPLVCLCWISLRISPFHAFMFGLLIIVVVMKRRVVLNLLQKSV